MWENPTADCMDAIDVSPELVTFVGAGRLPTDPWPNEPVALLFRFGNDRIASTVEYHSQPDTKSLNVGAGEHRLILVATREACERILGRAIPLDEGGSYFLPSALRTIALTIRDSHLPAAARLPYCLAKSIELLCDLLGVIRDDHLVPATGFDLSEIDSQRLYAARRLIDESWSEKLTLDSIARACGLNRNKLTSGFKKMFDCTVTDAITEQRLRAARQMLLSTELPVSSIGYKCGYLNNASFARAFSRHVGVAPTQYRAMEGVVA
ncbi:helix-turn-helix domain-containing protein [Hyphomonas sp.]|uniref:helix-turn-helix domain-containing protein n=1 Tax=Hyphomonas sp. TaxID=87 RepID=UPI003D2842A4